MPKAAASVGPSGESSAGAPVKVAKVGKLGLVGVLLRVVPVLMAVSDVLSSLEAHSGVRDAVKKALSDIVDAVSGV